MEVDMDMRKRGIEFVKNEFAITFNALIPTNPALPQVELTMRRTVESLSKIRGGSDKDEIIQKREFSKASRWMPLAEEPKK
jgi:hypothetical protein